MFAALILPADQQLSFVKAFFLTYRTFTTPRILLMKLMERYFIPGPLESVINGKTIQVRVCGALKVCSMWLSRH
jgi:hypothetical protein